MSRDDWDVLWRVLALVLLVFLGIFASVASAEDLDWSDCFVEVTEATPDLVAPPEVTQLEVLFDFDSAVLNLDDVRELRALAAMLKQRPSDEVIVDAHTDRRGTDAYNMVLSAERAETVTDFLRGHGVTATNVLASGEVYARFDEISNHRTRQPDRRAAVIVRWPARVIRSGTARSVTYLAPYTRQVDRTAVAADIWRFQFNTGSLRW